MIKLIKFFSSYYYSFYVKVLFSFIIFILIFNLLRFFLIIPKLEEQNLTNEIHNITRALLITKQQLKIISKSIKMQSKLEIESNQIKIKDEIENIYKNITSTTKAKEFISLFTSNDISNICSYKVSENNITLIEKIKKDHSFNKDYISKLNVWQKYISNENFKKIYKSYYIFKYKKRHNNLTLSMLCNSKDLNKNYRDFENSLKNEIKTTLLTDLELTNAKTTLFWINTNKIRLPRKDKNNKSSTVKKLLPENLTIKEILSAEENKPIEHKVHGKDTYTWIIKVPRGLPINKNYYTLAHTVMKEELINKSKSNIVLFLPETLLSIGISFIFIIFIFNRLLKNINTLTKIAKQVKLGVKNERTKLKGKDDIGILGEAFDSMLDFFENNIKILDKKVEEKTKVISNSLKEKDILLEENRTLLKEIHHRVKNNLALTIGLLQLQEDETEDEKTLKVLRDIQERIYTMELLHRKLYESTNLNKIVLEEYIKDLVNIISRSYDFNKNIKTNINIDEIEVNIDTAMPCGLIINELVTNAYKYAFVENNSPVLDIQIIKEKEFLFIKVKDNGKGLDKDFKEICDETLGLELINTIVKHQLSGTIDYIYENGAKFIIKVKIIK